MTYPTPSGTITGASAYVQQPYDTGNFTNDMNAIVAQMNAQGDTQLATEYQQFAIGFHAQYPQYSANQAVSAFLATALGASLSAGITGTGTALGQIPQAAATGAENAVNNLSNPLDLLGSFNLGSWFLRIGEILLGLVLIGVGVARITGASNFISSAVKAKI